MGGGGGGPRFLVSYTIEASYEQNYLRTPESESERNLTNYFIFFLLLFY